MFGINVYAAQPDVGMIEAGGWHESAYAKWSQYEGAESYNVYVKGTGGYTKIDNELIRKYPDYFIADVPGLASGKYTIKIVPVVNGSEAAAAAKETAAVTVDNFVREGFAFSEKSPYGYTTGAYNKDGTLKSDAEVLYITNKNKDSVTLGGDESKGVGLYNIMAYREAKKITTPLAVRFIGKVEMPKGTQDYMLGIKNTQNVTFEGIGEDATIHGWGLTMKCACNIEVRNLGIMWYGGVGGEQTETTTAAAVNTAGVSWNADKEIPSWLDLGGASKGGNSSSHNVFTGNDAEIKGLSNRYTLAANGLIKITLSDAAAVKVFISGNNNSAGKGKVTAELDGTENGSYLLPGRKDSTATPFEITASKGGLLTLTTSYESLIYKVEILSDNASEQPETPERPETPEQPQTSGNVVVTLAFFELGYRCGKRDNDTKNNRPQSPKR